MRYRALAGLVLLVMVGTVLGGCATADPLLDLSEQLATGQTIIQVQGLMSPEVLARATIYPAKRLRLEPTGNWTFTAQEGGAAGDTDAPFQVMMVGPAEAGTNILTILFDDNSLVASIWYAAAEASTLASSLTPRATD